MKTHTKPFSVASLCQRKKRIDPTPDYQRPPVWMLRQKQLLVDSILRDYDIPKMYFLEVNRDDGVQYEVIDGQQRLRTIWEFMDGQFRLLGDMDPVGYGDQHYECAGKSFDGLHSNIQSIFEDFTVDVVIVQNAIQTENEDEVRDMFLRLQNGTILKAQEKRNAMPGQMRDFIKKLAMHKLFESCKFTNRRYTFDHLAAQLTCLEIHSCKTSVKDADLNRMYDSNRIFDENGKIAKKVKRVLDFLLSAFPQKTPELERYNLITLYCLCSNLLDAYPKDGLAEKLSRWFIGFEQMRWQQEDLAEEQRDYELVDYRRLTSQSTDADESIRKRLEILEKRFFVTVPDLVPLDEQRDFKHEQRLAIYRRDKGICQLAIKCEGEKLGWNDWHADHVLPFTEGGRTTVANGQVTCAACNTSKGKRAIKGVAIA